MVTFRVTHNGVLLSSPIGAQISYLHEGRILWDVIGYRIADIEGERMRVLLVRHFNGEPWPVEPFFMSVSVLRS